MRTIVYEWSGWRELETLPANVRARLIAAIEGLAVDPHPSASKMIRGREKQFSLRVGDYRILYAIDDAAQIVIASVGHRRDVYR